MTTQEFEALREELGYTYNQIAELADMHTSNLEYCRKKGEIPPSVSRPLKEAVAELRKAQDVEDNMHWKIREHRDKIDELIHKIEMDMLRLKYGVG
ncbi:MAG: hypothetical protein ACFB15_25830 [Cyclobacteriaceae bacterium]